MPGYWASYFRIEYAKEDQTDDSLGKRITFLNQRLSQLCMLHNMQRKANRISTQVYCEDTEAVSQWGCHEKNLFKRKRKHRKTEGLIKRKNISKKNFIPRKIYYQKRRNFKRNSTDRCKCYNCGEEGHKSYECNKMKVKISKIDREEIESDLESISSIKSEDFYTELYEEFSESSTHSKE